MNVAYRDAKAVTGDEKFKRVAAAAGYSYAFSKRTSCYTAVTYARQKYELKDKDRTPSAVGVITGLVHKF